MNANYIYVITITFRERYEKPMEPFVTLKNLGHANQIKERERENYYLNPF